MPDLELEKRKTCKIEQWTSYLNSHLPLLYGQAIKNIEKLQVRQKRAYNEGKWAKYGYKAGDLVVRKNLEKSGFPKERWSCPWVVMALNNKEGPSFEIFRYKY